MPGLISVAQHAVRRRARRRRDRGAALFHGASMSSAAEGLLAPRRAGRRLARLQRRPGAPRRHHRQGHQGGDGATRGWFKHPFFVGARLSRRRRSRSGPAAANPLADESGHGTGESANIFAVAPDVELLPVKMNFVNSHRRLQRGGRARARTSSPAAGAAASRIGPLSAADQALAAAIAAAVAVGDHRRLLGRQRPLGLPRPASGRDLGRRRVHERRRQRCSASNYASGFIEQRSIPDRRVPDLCGLVGMRPSATYIMLPLEPG